MPADAPAMVGVQRVENLSLEDFAEILATAQMACPVPEPNPVDLCDISPGALTRFEIPEGWQAGDIVHIELRCGQLEVPFPSPALPDRTKLETCFRVEGETRRSATSDTEEIVSDRPSIPPECVPMPEPGIVLMLFLGVLGLAIAGRAQKPVRK